MTTYRPILKAKPGEFEAVGALDPTIAAGVMPVFELCPETDTLKAVANAMLKAKKYLSAGSVIGLDCGHLPHTVGGVVVPHEASRGLGAVGIDVLPVVRVSDTAAVRTSLAAVIAAHTGQAVLRHDVAPDGTSSVLTPAAVASLVGSLGIASSDLHLVLDVGALTTSVAIATAAVSAPISAATSIGSWASITVAAGAFPASISNLATGVRHDIKRKDASLWRSVSASGGVVDFGDYAVNHPAIATGGRGPLPNLRYTNGRDWSVWREAKARPGNESFYDLCKKVIADPAWAGAAFSWGDQKVDEKAAEVPGAGTATQWRAYGTSHHITSVVDRLAILGEP